MPVSTIICMIICVMLNFGGFAWGLHRVYKNLKKEEQK